MKYLKFVIPIAVLAVAGGVFFLNKTLPSPAEPRDTSPYKEEDKATRSPSDISKVPILTYHSFGPKPERKESASQLHYRITVENFDAQMNYLVDEGYTTTTFADLIENQISGKPIPEKPIVLTFDDGWKNQYDYALPILEKYNMTGTFFIITNSTGTKSYMSIDELKDLHAKGFEIAAHTKTHPKLITLDTVKLSDEIKGSKKFLEDNVGSTVKTIAYPYYLHNEQVRTAVKDAGYIGARGGWAKFTNDPMHLFEFKSQEPVSNPNPFAEKRIAD